MKEARCESCSMRLRYIPRYLNHIRSFRCAKCMGIATLLPGQRQLWRYDEPAKDTEVQEIEVR